MRFRPSCLLTIPLLLCLLASCASYSVPTDKPFLWRATHDDRPTPIYLYGTRHSSDPRITNLPDSVRVALAEADLVLTELPQNPARRRELFPRLWLPKGRSSRSILGDETFDKLTTLASLPSSFAERMKPEILTLAVIGKATLGAGRIERYPLDALIAHTGAIFGARTEALETLDEQLANMPEVSRLLQRMLRKVPRWLLSLLPDSEESSVRKYLRGDLNALANDKTPSDSQVARMIRLMTESRDQAMAERLLEHANRAPNDTIFVAVGALHFPGKGGILERIEAAGYRIERLPGRTGTNAKKAIQDRVLQKLDRKP